jgi:hypothetical protein
VGSEPPANPGRFNSREAERARPTEPIRIDEATHAWARAALEREASNVSGATVGTRNHTLNRAAFSLGQIAGTGLIDAPTVQRLLTASALAAGLTEPEARATIASGLNAGERLPRGPKNRTRTPTRRISREPFARGRDLGMEAEVTPPDHVR